VVQYGRYQHNANCNLLNQTNLGVYLFKINFSFTLCVCVCVYIYIYIYRSYMALTPKKWLTTIFEASIIHLLWHSAFLVQQVYQIIVINLLRN